MAAFPNLAVRDDFRCAVCRRKHAFHCEHDTPYRDQFLGAYDAEKPYMPPSSNHRDSRRTTPHHYNNSTNDHRMHETNYGRNTNSQMNAQYQQGTRSENSALWYPNSNAYEVANEHKKKKSSCVIL